jgi:AraC-like DNA-binding protein
MQTFYKKALFALLALVLSNALLAAFLIDRSYLSLAVLAPQQDGARWLNAGETDSAWRGTSTIRIHDPDGARLRYDLKLTTATEYPFAGAALALHDKHDRLAQVDWSKYTTATFLAKCAPANLLIFAVLAFDDNISRLGDFPTYRTPQSFFSCNQRGVPVSVDLTRLTMPEWWFAKHKLPVSLQDYKLNKVSKVVFGTSFQSPSNVESRVEISEFMLHGRDYRFIAALAAILAAGWSAFGIWFFRAHSRALTASLESKRKNDLPLAAYRQLTLEPYKDKEKASVLRFIATNYTDAELDLDAVVAGTGANRNKINDVLKAELGMTFTAYLNKLRLTEAGRLLAEHNGATISEIAYSVGYANVSYFNRLFKEEYGCAPKAYRALSVRQEAPAEPSPSPPPPLQAGTLHF